MTAPQTLAGQLAAVARFLIRRADASTVGIWPRAAALLARESLEQSIDRLWARCAPEMENASTRAQLVTLPSYLDPTLAREVSYTWWALSEACHFHAYELASTADELGLAIEHVVLIERLLPWDLARSSHRHRLVQRFADRVYQAFGLARAGPLFRTGQLYGRDGRPIDYSIAGTGVWDNAGNRQARVFDDGAIVDAADAVVAFVADGVVLDARGHTVGLLEVAPGHGCPDDFLPVALLNDPRARVFGGNPGEPLPTDETRVVPQATGRWSEQTLGELITTPESGPSR